MRNGTGIMRLERAQDPEGRGDNVYKAIDSTEEEVRGSSAKTR